MPIHADMVRHMVMDFLPVERIPGVCNLRGASLRLRANFTLSRFAAFTPD